MYFKAMICDKDDACVSIWERSLGKDGEVLFGCVAGVQRYRWCAD